jgi:hypothetical protein
MADRQCSRPFPPCYNRAIDTEPKVTNPFRFRTRHLFTLTFLVALVPLVCILAKNEYERVIESIELHYSEMAEHDGTMTREQARKEIWDDC